MACLIRVVCPKSPDTQTNNSDDCINNDHIEDQSNQSKLKNRLSLKELSMEEALIQILREEEVIDDTWSFSRSRKYFKVEFSVAGSDEMERILDRLAFFNIGKTVDSSIMVIEPTAFVQKRIKQEKKTGIISHNAFQNFVKSLKSRLCVAQVYNEINQNGSFDMNYLCFLLCASVVADIALVTNSAGVVFASMLLSPLMDPIMCILFGLNLREKNMIKKGLRNTSISLALCIFMGLTFGYIAHLLSGFQDVRPYPTPEMIQRGAVKSFLASMLVAAFSGVSVSFATLSKRLSALIGNAISLSLLPPAVNCGQLMLLSLIALTQNSYVPIAKMNETSNFSVDPLSPDNCYYPWVKDYQFLYVDHMCQLPKELAITGLCSLLLTTMNILLILVTGYSVNKLKDLAPRSFTNEVTRTFYQKDVREVMDNYDCVHKFDANNLASYAYKEYLRLNQINPETNEFDTLSPEESNRIAHDFQALVEDIQQDNYLQTITAKTTHGDSSFMKNFIKVSTDLLDQNSNKICRRNTIAPRSRIKDRDYADSNGNLGKRNESPINRRSVPAYFASSVEEDSNPKPPMFFNPDGSIGSGADYWQGSNPNQDVEFPNHVLPKRLLDQRNPSELGDNLMVDQRMGPKTSSVGKFKVCPTQVSLDKLDHTAAMHSANNGEVVHRI